MVENEITRENIETMVIGFYLRILEDKLLGPYFVEALGDDIRSKRWAAHLKILVDFWASITIDDNSYHGSALFPHLSMEGLDEEVFKQWLRYFFSTVDSIYEPKLANIFKQRASVVAENFMRNMGIDSYKV